MGNNIITEQRLAYDLNNFNGSDKTTFDHHPTEWVHYELFGRIGLAAYCSQYIYNGELRSHVHVQLINKQGDVWKPMETGNFTAYYMNQYIYLFNEMNNWISYNCYKGVNNEFSQLNKFVEFSK